ncbi:MAG: TspO/MBR family protein [Gemmatimonadaceae bacterium]
MTNTPIGSIKGFAGWLIVTFIAAGAGAIASVDSPSFYQQLARPAWAPPSWLFGPVWTALYLLMAIAAWMVWRQAGGFAEARIPLSLFIAQLTLNGLWTWLFFAWKQGALAVADIAILWILVVATIIGFWRIRPSAGVLMLPYIAWVSFAGALSLAVWRLNPGLL